MAFDRYSPNLMIPPAEDEPPYHFSPKFFRAIAFFRANASALAFMLREPNPADIKKYGNAFTAKLER